MEIRRYTPGDRERWDAFVHASKNATFLFLRDYMGYHADRFQDGSLLFLAEGQLVAILPASVVGRTLVSHGGLTYGGLILGPRTRATEVLACMEALVAHLATEGFQVLRYKAIPHIYHQVPAEEDLYAIFRVGARLVRRDISSTIYLDEHRPALTKGRKWALNKGRKAGLTIERSDDYATFLQIATENLEAKYGTRPVHTADEMAMLATRFPDYIQLHVARRDGRMLAGTVMYAHRHVAHAQYIASTAEGKDAAAFEVLLATLLEEVYRDRTVFDFGISTEQDGRYLNEGLIGFKESFGGRGICYDTYEVDLHHP